DRGESACALADQEPALPIQISLGLCPADRGEQVERRALAGLPEIGAGAAAVGVAEMLPAARAVAAPYRDDHRVPPTDPLANWRQRAVTSDGAVGFRRRRGTVAQDDPRKRPVTGRPAAGDH